MPAEMVSRKGTSRISLIFVMLIRDVAFCISLAPLFPALTRAGSGDMGHKRRHKFRERQFRVRLDVVAV